MTGQYTPGQGFTQSPRLAMAQMLMQRGSSTAPVGSAVEGIARALTGAVGGYFGGRAKEDQRDALAEALKALEDPSVPDNARVKVAYQKFAEKAPDMANPFEQTMLSQMVPKERWVDVTNKAGQVVGQRNSISGEFKPGKLENISQGQRALNAFGEVVAEGGAKLPDGMVQNPDGSVSVVPNFTQALTGIEEAKAGGAQQGRANVDLRMNPQIIRAETGPKAAQAGAVSEATAAGGNRGQLAQVQTPEGPRPGVQEVQRVTQVGQRQGQNAVPTAPSGYRMKENGAVPIEGGPADPATIETVAQAQARGAGTFDSQKKTGEDKLRDDFKLSPAVKMFSEAAPIYDSMRDAATRNTKAADLNLVYGLAKIFDPTSVVREGEMVMVKNTSSLPDWLVGTINGVNGGAVLQPETRKSIMDEAGSRVQGYKTQYDKTVSEFSRIANERGLNPANITVGPVAPKMDSVQGIAGVPSITDDAAGRLALKNLPAGKPYYGPDGVLYTKGPQ
jgi:hypothetical protein